MLLHLGLYYIKGRLLHLGLLTSFSIRKENLEPSSILASDFTSNP